MPKITITPAAESDLTEIWLYISEGSISAADAFLDNVNEKCMKISLSPLIGRARDELAPSLRSYPVGRYVIYYRPVKNGIEIIRVLSGSRDVISVFPEV